ncbi:MAG: hypothetical protein DHS20C15_29390 [Planctomycetota bacterium]|nr:MAG: hypothetical protein DHS20C15_29390 [Planctomycetota bacterium]
MISLPFRSALAGLSLFAVLSAPAAADDALAKRAVLQFGPVIGGEDVHIHLRTQAPNAFAALFLSLSGTPTPLPGPFLPALGLDLTGSVMHIRQLDASGRDLLSAPTVAGTFGPTSQSLPLFAQYLIQPAGQPRLLSNVAPVFIEPGALLNNSLVDDAAARLPTGYDQFGGTQLVHADVNRDGYQDLVLGNELEVAFWINDGTGHFVDETAARFTQSGESVGPIAVADVNGDTLLDLVVAGGYDDFGLITDRQYLNDGFGNFTLDSGALPSPVGLTNALEFGDVDGDGDVDLMIASGEATHLGGTGGVSRLLINDGAGNWSEQAAFSALGWNDGSLTVNAVRLGDIDNDGDLDAFVARTGSAFNVLLKNDGSGVFSDASAQLGAFFVDNSGDATFADLDLDGYLDLIVANSHASIDGASSGDLFFNQGASNPGFFVEDDMSILETSTPADFIRLAIRTADVDGDGDLDMLVGVHDLFFGADQLLLVNRGGIQGGQLGQFLRATWFDPGDYICYGVDAFDMDNDGDIDVMQLASGVITGDPVQQFRARLFENLRN